MKPFVIHSFAPEWWCRLSDGSEYRIYRCLLVGEHNHWAILLHWLKEDYDAPVEVLFDSRCKLGEGIDPNQLDFIAYCFNEEFPPMSEDDLAGLKAQIIYKAEQLGLTVEETTDDLEQ